MKYDPREHDGLLNDGAGDIVIPDAKKAALHELSIDTRRALQAGTMIAEARVKNSTRHGITKSEGGILLRGYRAGLKLLGL
jgi:hypothetical protein